MKSISSLRLQHVFRQGNFVKYAWIEKNQINFQTTIMCKVFKVDRSSYYHWVKMGSIIEKVNEPLDTLIQEIFEEGRKKYGTRPIQSKLLNRYGIIISRKKLGKIMKRLNLVVKRKKKLGLPLEGIKIPQILNIIYQ